jgi:hypothetical protein
MYIDTEQYTLSAFSPVGAFAMKSCTNITELHHVCLFKCNYLRNAEQIFVKFYVEKFY